MSRPRFVATKRVQAMAIDATDTKLTYISILEARAMTGLRIVLGDFAIPIPWREACKGVFYVKGLAYTAVRSADEGALDIQLGMNGTHSELVAWTAQSSVPVVIWNEERPRALWNDQLLLAERLAPEIPLIPTEVEERARMFGLAHEIMGGNGLLDNSRHFMSGPVIASLPDDSPDRELFEYFGRKYGYTDEALAGATARIVGILGALDAQLSAQRARGRRYLVGEHLSALDIYWAASCAFFDPMPEALCPMATAFRVPLLYGTPNSEIERALTNTLREHRDFIYDKHLELPVVF